jgi:hypothetical protein
MTRTLFLTEYSVGDETYGSEILATDEKEAALICTERGIGESVLGESDSKPITIKDIHMICFMSFIALKSGKMTVDEILSDRGVLHEAIHILDGFVDDKIKEEFTGKLKRLVEITHSAPSVPAFLSIFNGIVPGGNPSDDAATICPF